MYIYIVYKRFILGTMAPQKKKNENKGWKEIAHANIN